MHHKELYGRVFDAPSLTPCPHCDAALNAIGSLVTEWRLGYREQAPKLGAYAICQHCQGVSRFAAGSQLVRISEDQLSRLEHDTQTQIQAARRNILARVRAAAR
jgi:hypothetical protein